MKIFVFLVIVIFTRPATAEIGIANQRLYENRRNPIFHFYNDQILKGEKQYLTGRLEEINFLNPTKSILSWGNMFLDESNKNLTLHLQPQDFNEIEFSQKIVSSRPPSLTDRKIEFHDGQIIFGQIEEISENALKFTHHSGGKWEIPLNKVSRITPSVANVKPFISYNKLNNPVWFNFLKRSIHQSVWTIEENIPFSFGQGLLVLPLGKQPEIYLRFKADISVNYKLHSGFTKTPKQKYLKPILKDPPIKYIEDEQLFDFSGLDALEMEDTNFYFYQDPTHLQIPIEDSTLSLRLGEKLQIRELNDNSLIYSNYEGETPDFIKDIDFKNSTLTEENKPLTNSISTFQKWWDKPMNFYEECYLSKSLKSYIISSQGKPIYQISIPQKFITALTDNLSLIFLLSSTESIDEPNEEENSLLSIRPASIRNLEIGTWFPQENSPKEIPSAPHSSLHKLRLTSGEIILAKSIQLESENSLSVILENGKTKRNIPLFDVLEWVLPHSKISTKKNPTIYTHFGEIIYFQKIKLVKNGTIEEEIPLNLPKMKAPARYIAPDFEFGDNSIFEFQTNFGSGQFRVQELKKILLK